MNSKLFYKRIAALIFACALAAGSFSQGTVAYAAKQAGEDTREEAVEVGEDKSQETIRYGTVEEAENETAQDTQDTQATGEEDSSQDKISVEIQTPNIRKGYVKKADGTSLYADKSLSSKKVKKLSFDTKVMYSEVNSKWVLATSGKKSGYVLKKSIIDDNEPVKTMKVKGASAFKSYMSYKAIGNKTSPQYKLQKKAKTTSQGLRTVNGRYCIAIGQGAGAHIGQYVDVVLENGTVIKCIVSDFKGNSITTTKSSHMVTKGNGCASEFLVSMGKLKSAIKNSGDASKADSSWSSKVVEIKLYDADVDI